MISQTAEYALRAVVYLAQQIDGPRARSQIASATEIPLDYLQKVLQILVRGGILSTQRGPGGGYRLVRPAQDLTVYDVISAIDPSARISMCPLGLPDHHTLCPLHHSLDKAAEMVENTFRQTRIEDILPNSGNSSACHFPDRQQDR